MKLKLASSLVAGAARLNKFLKSYQWVFTSKSNEISGSSYLNYGWGGTDANLAIGDVQIATVDTNTQLQGDYNILAGATISEFIGTATPYIDGDKIKFSVSGTCIKLDILTTEETHCIYWFKEQNGIKIYDANGITTELTVILDTFSQAPQLILGVYKFPDLSGFGNNIPIKNQRVGTFNSLSTISTGKRIEANTSIYFKIIIYFENITGTQYLLSCSGGGNSAGYSLYTTNNILIFSLKNGTVNYPKNIGFISLGYNEIELEWDGIIGNNITTTVSNLSDSNTTSVTITGSWWVGESAGLFLLGFVSSLSFTGKCAYAKLLTSSLSFEYVFNNGQGATIYDISGNGNDGTVTTSVLLTFWGSTSDEAIPYEHVLGATLYKNNSNNTIMPICADLTGVEKVGFTNLGYFPPASGALKGLPNTYHISGVDAIIPEGDYTANEIGALSGTGIGLIQDEFSVKSLIVRA